MGKQAPGFQPALCCAGYESMPLLTNPRGRFFQCFFMDDHFLLEQSRQMS